MKIHQNIAPRTVESQTRLLLLLTGLFFTLWLAQLRFPPLSYPHIGLLLLVIAVAMCAFLPYHVFKMAKAGEIMLLRHPALLPAAGFVGWMLTRWLIEGLPATGAAGVGTVLWAAAYFIIAVSLAWVTRQTEAFQRLGQFSVTPVFLMLLLLVGLLCGFHAVWQYHIGYNNAYQELLAAIGSRAPDRTELGLLHHLKLRRVTSIWGDPNALATFSAIAICASLELAFSAKRLKVAWRVAAGISIAASLAAVYFSGSRGGVLDVAFVFIIYGAFPIAVGYKGRRSGGAAGGVVGIVLTLLVVWPAGSARAKIDAAVVSPVEATQSGWVWRSNTIRERFYYLQVGARMIAKAPLVGMGPGSVETWFGRLKPAEAREARHLHNWLVQIWAELGLVGLGLLAWFLAALVWRCRRVGLWRTAYERALVVIFVLLLLDGLIQISWHQRELMCIFGLVCGLITATTGFENERAPFLGGREMRWLAGCGALAFIFLFLEIRELSARSNKQMARDAAYAGDAASAQKYWQRASRWTPQDPEPLVARASMALERGQLSVARALVEKALEVQPYSAASHAFAAEIYQNLRQPGKVDEHLTNALELYPVHPEYNYQYAQFLANNGQLPKALIYARRAVDNNYQAEEQAKYIGLLKYLQVPRKE